MKDKPANAPRSLAIRARPDAASATLGSPKAGNSAPSPVPSPATQNALGRLHDLAVFVRAMGDLDANLKHLVELAASVTNASSCSILLLADGESAAPQLKLWCSTDAPGTAATREIEAAVEPVIGEVLARGRPALVGNFRAAAPAPNGRSRPGDKAPLICAPIAVGSQIIGVMTLSSSPAAERFDEADLDLAEIVATLIGKLVQVERLQTLLRSRIAHLSLAKEEKAVVARITDGSVPPARVAKLLAKTFFRDLSSAGFAPGQIIEAASEIITLISTDVRRFKRRTDREAKE